MDNAKFGKFIMKPIFRILMIVSIIFILFIISAFSKVKMHTYNPIRAFVGYIQIQIFDKDYVFVSDIPTKTMYAKEEFNMKEYMEERGFYWIEEEQMGYMNVFSNGEEKICITFWSVLDGYPFNIYDWDKTIPDNREKDLEKNMVGENEIEIPIINMTSDILINNVN